MIKREEYKTYTGEYDDHLFVANVNKDGKIENLRIGFTHGSSIDLGAHGVECLEEFINHIKQDK